MKRVNAVTYSKDFKTEGHKPVLILADDRKKYVIKPQRADRFDYSIYNEILAHHFLKLWGFHSPEIALIKVDKEILKNSINAKTYKAGSFKLDFFGSEFVENCFEINEMYGFSKKVDFKKLERPETLIRLGLFDIWLENDDRKPTNYNILFSQNNQKIAVVPIDNAFLFSTLDYSQITPANGVCNSVNDNVLYSQIACQIIKKVKPSKKWIELQRELFYLCIKKCQGKFDEIIETIQPYIPLNTNERLNLKKFLFHKERNEQVFNDFLSRIKK